jgi:hypothetical protein
MALTFFSIPMAFACVMRLVRGLRNPQSDLLSEVLNFTGTAMWACAIWLLINIVA